MPASPFHGELVTLRAFEPNDAEALAAYLNDPALIGRRGLPWGMDEREPLSSKRIADIIEKWAGREKGYTLAVVSAVTHELFGHAACGWDWDPIDPWLNVVIAPAHQRQGYGIETARLLIDFLFQQTPAHVVTTSYPDWNAAAQSFANKLGFTETGRMRWTGLRNGQPTDEIFADILKREWQEAAR
jgi:RimJ/RimL family protein N-acetyltransferase